MWAKVTYLRYIISKFQLFYEKLFYCYVFKTKSCTTVNPLLSVFNKKRKGFERWFCRMFHREGLKFSDI
jgi:hypothetical protein